MVTFAVIGAGAVGGYYGSKLAIAGNEVHFVFRRDADLVRSQGLHVRSVDGDYAVAAPLVHESVDTLPQVDVVLVAVKSLANDEVAPTVARVVKPGGTVVLIQNGLGGEPDYAKSLGDDIEVIGGLAFLNSQRTGPNEVSHTGNGMITLATYRADYEPAGRTPRLDQVAAAFDAAGVPVTVEDDLLRARWTKLLWNIPFNSLSVVLRADTVQLMTTDASRLLVEQVMDEVLAAAEADGRALADGLKQLLLDATASMPAYATSMKVDFDNYRPIEVESIVGEPLRRGQRHGVSMPTIETIYRCLTFISAHPDQPR